MDGCGNEGEAPVDYNTGVRNQIRPADCLLGIDAHEIPICHCKGVE